MYSHLSVGCGFESHRGPPVLSLVEGYFGRLMTSAWAGLVSTTLENEAVATVENEATGWWF